MGYGFRPLFADYSKRGRRAFGRVAETALRAAVEARNRRRVVMDRTRPARISLTWSMVSNRWGAMEGASQFHRSNKLATWHLEVL
jgi:hypothetical protein